MERVITYAPLDEVDSADLNEWQDLTQGARSATSNNAIAADKAVGTDTRVAQTSVAVADASLALVDDSVDWRDRRVTVSCTRVAAGDRMGQSTDYNLNVPTVTSVTTLTSTGYTARGAYANLTTGANVSNGNPPLNGAGVYRSEAPIIDDLSTSGYVYLYAYPSDGALYVYNNTGGALYLILEVTGTGATGLRP